MGNVLINEDYMRSAADAIRTKKSSTAGILAENFAQEILSIPTGGSATLIDKTITENGTYLASEDNADGYSKVTVDVQGGGGRLIPNFTYNTLFEDETGVQNFVLSKSFQECKLLRFTTYYNGRYDKFIITSNQLERIRNSPGIVCFDKYQTNHYIALYVGADGVTFTRKNSRYLLVTKVEEIIPTNCEIQIEPIYENSSWTQVMPTDGIDIVFDDYDLLIPVAGHSSDNEAVQPSTAINPLGLMYDSFYFYPYNTSAILMPISDNHINYNSSARIYLIDGIKFV